MLVVYFARDYPETTAVLVLENPIGLEDYRSAIPPQPIETLFKTDLPVMRAAKFEFVCRGPAATGRQRHRLHRYGGLGGRQVAGPAKGGRAARHQGRVLVQPGNGTVRRILPESLKAAAASL
jgi:hypothetical protein